MCACTQGGACDAGLECHSKWCVLIESEGTLSSTSAAASPSAGGTPLDPIAAGGGTHPAYLVDGSQQEPADAIVGALRSIRDEALENL